MRLASGLLAWKGVGLAEWLGCCKLRRSVSTAIMKYFQVSVFSAEGFISFAFLRSGDPDTVASNGSSHIGD